MRQLRSEELAQSIMELIEQRGLRAGDRMPTESELMEQFDASRNPLREALRTLQALGIVEIRHGHGTVVGSASMASLSPSLLFRVRERSREDLRGLHDLLEVRQILETELTRKVAAHATDVDGLLAELDDCVQQMRDPQAAMAADRRFHEIICAAADNDLALELVRVFWDVYQQAEDSLVSAPTSQPDTLVAKHQAIADALRSGRTDLIDETVCDHFDEIRNRFAAPQP